VKPKQVTPKKTGFIKSGTAKKFFLNLIFNLTHCNGWPIAARMKYDILYLKGLIVLLNAINNGACAHKKASTLQVLTFAVKLMESGCHVPDIKDSITQAKNLITKYYKRCPVDPNPLEPR
jgi:hypothetical protein